MNTTVNRLWSRHRKLKLVCIMYILLDLTSIILFQALIFLLLMVVNCKTECWKQHVYTTVIWKQHFASKVLTNRYPFIQNKENWCIFFNCISVPFCLQYHSKYTCIQILFTFVVNNILHQTKDIYTTTCFFRPCITNSFSYLLMVYYTNLILFHQLFSSFILPHKNQISVITKL